VCSIIGCIVCGLVCVMSLLMYFIDGMLVDFIFCCICSSKIWSYEGVVLSISEVIECMCKVS